MDLFTRERDLTGAIVEVGAEVTVTGNAALAITVQHRRVGSVTVGPVALPTLTGEYDFPAVHTTFNHWLAAVGLSLDL